MASFDFKDTDDDWLRAQKAFWQLALAMPEPEQSIFLQEEWVKEEEQRLEWMLDCRKRDTRLLEDITARATEHVQQYEKTSDEKHLTAAEEWVGIARSIKETRFTIGDIRKQRERIQWERTKLTKLRGESAES